MHRAMYIGDVATSVARELKHCPVQNLVALACTCRALSEPALDVVWRYQTLWRLVRCIRKEIWTITPYDPNLEPTNDYEWDGPFTLVRIFCRLSRP
jgi:hypothetical protein